MADLERFARNISVRAQGVKDNVDILVRKVALATDTAVVLATPVDTGRARSNWQVGIGEAKSGTVGPQSQAEVLSEAKTKIDKYKGEGEIHLTNNLPYINPLNEGSSKQAPSGYVEKAVAAGAAVIRNTRVVK
jgi:hypothetical protein